MAFRDETVPMTQGHLGEIMGAIRAARSQVLACLVAYNQLGGDNPGILPDENAEALDNAISVHDTLLRSLEALGGRG